MYEQINTIFRTAINNAAFSYLGNILPVYFQGDWGSDDGAHVRAKLFTNEENYREVGSFEANPALDVSGFYQVGFFLPSSDNGLEYSLNALTDDLRVAFKRQGFMSGSLKMEYLSTTRNEQLRIDGHETITCRVNFRAFTCVDV